MKDRNCKWCEYHKDGCRFPEPQHGGEAPFMVVAACVDERDGGANCIQFRDRLDRGRP